MGFLDPRGAREAGAERMAAEGLFSFALVEIAANPGGESGFLDEPGDVLVGEAFGRDTAVFVGHGAKHRPVTDPPEPQPCLQHRDRAGKGRKAAADFDFAPAGPAVDGEQQAAVARRPRTGLTAVRTLGLDAVRWRRVAENLDPTGPVLGLVGAAIEPDDFRAAQAAGEADREKRPVAQGRASRRFSPWRSVSRMR
jgi:hypothetical protein